MKQQLIEIIKKNSIKALGVLLTSIGKEMTDAIERQGQPVTKGEYESRIGKSVFPEK